MRFARQEIIDGWNQIALREATVAVHGHGWCGVYLVAALGSLGIGKIIWLGKTQPETARLAQWLIGESGPFPDCVIEDLSFDPEYASALEWSLGSTQPETKIFVDTGEESGVNNVYREYFRLHQPCVRCLAGGSVGGGWLDVDQGAMCVRNATMPGDPPAAMAVAALLADIIRMILSPLADDLPYSSGALNWNRTTDGLPRTIAIVGVGAIGVSAAAVLAACGHRMLLIDSDTVEASNLNRQWLFNADDSRVGKDKATAATDRLCAIFPGIGIDSIVARVDSGFEERLPSFNPHPEIIVSAVDNAATRLVLQDLGQRLGIPVVQAGTGLSAADCYSQLPGGVALDNQMFGLLAAASLAERGREASSLGRCAIEPSFVVPGLVAGAMIGRQVQHLSAVRSDVAQVGPLHWRQGFKPGGST